jgi:thioredoxin reductase
VYDVIIVGGSYAGMAAALQLVRARRTVCILDTGLRRNRFASTSHGFLGQDGKAPSAIAGEAKVQLLKYPNLTWRDNAAVFGEKTGDYFTVHTAQNEVLTAWRLVLAMGVVDELPKIPGLAERWGKSVFHCPYCHGYELDGGSIGVLATNAASLHQALLIPDWGQTTLFTNGILEPDDDQLRQLKMRHVKIERELVTEINGKHASVNLRDGRVTDLVGLFVTSRVKVASPLPEQLGCEFADSPLGSCIKTDGTQETSITGVFACGDVARPAGSITFAIADGAMAGMAVHRSFILSELIGNTL